MAIATATLCKGGEGYFSFFSLFIGSNNILWTLKRTFLNELAFNMQLKNTQNANTKALQSSDPAFTDDTGVHLQPARLLHILAYLYA
jgi:hypothetical protein